MFQHPLVRQILGACAGSAIAAVLYLGYTSASHAVGGDLAHMATAALLGGQETGREVARVVESASEPAPLPELGVPLRERAMPTPPPPQPERLTPETIIDAEPTPTESAVHTPPIAVEDADRTPPAAIIRPAAPQEPLAAMTKAAALPNSGAADWLVLLVSAGAAAGWHRQRLTALATRVRSALQ